MGISFAEFKALEKVYDNDIPRQTYSKRFERDIRKQVEEEFKDKLKGMSKKQRKKYIINMVKSRARKRAEKKIKRKGAISFGKYLLEKAGGSVAPNIIARFGLKGLAGPIGWAMWGYDALKYANCYRSCSNGCY